MAEQHSIQCRMLGNNTDECICSSNTMPMVDAMDLLDRFWNASLSQWAEDWTAFGIECECGNCKTCGMRNVLSWTMAVLSNPSLADLAQRKAAEHPAAEVAPGQDKQPRCWRGECRTGCYYPETCTAPTAVPSEEGR